MNKYTSLKSKHQKEINAFPFGFAFNQSQFDEMMTKWCLDPKNTGAIFSIGGGGYIRKADADAMHEMFDRHEAEWNVAIQDEEFMFEMFNYELANHEYSYTGDLTDTLEALNLTMNVINETPGMADALKRAIAAQED